MGAVLSTVAGNPCPVLSPVPSATPLYCADVRLTLREWLDALIGRDVLSEKSVETEATRLLPSRPRASRRIGNPSEAVRGGASGERASARGPRQGGELVPRSRPYGVGLGRIGESIEASWLSLGFDIYKV